MPALEGRAAALSGQPAAPVVAMEDPTDLDRRWGERPVVMPHQADPADQPASLTSDGGPLAEAILPPASHESLDLGSGAFQVEGGHVLAEPRLPVNLSQWFDIIGSPLAEPQAFGSKLGR